MADTQHTQGELFGKPQSSWRNRPRVHKRLWSPDRDAAIRQEYEAGQSIASLAAKHHASEQTVTRTIRRAGGAIRDAREAARMAIATSMAARREANREDREAIAREYLAGERIVEMARRRGVCRDVVWRVLVEMGIPRKRHNGRPCELNHDAFADAENSPLASYFAGLLFADGCVFEGETVSTVSLGMSGEDGAFIVSAFRSFLGSTHKINVADRVVPGVEHAATQYKLGVASRRMVEQLARYGITPRKSMTATVPACMQNNRDWWRGVVDGDGWLGINSLGAAYLGACGSHPTCEAFLAWVRTITPTNAQVTRNNSIWQGKVGCRHAYRVAVALYRNCAVALPGKRAKAEEIMALGEKKRWSLS